MPHQRLWQDQVLFMRICLSLKLPLIWQKEALIARLRTDRITGAGIFDAYQEAKDLGLDSDRRKMLFDDLQKLTLDQVKDFQEKWVKDRKYTYCVLGDEKELDMKKLSSYGPVERLTTEQIFGY